MKYIYRQQILQQINYELLIFSYFVNYLAKNILYVIKLTYKLILILFNRLLRNNYNIIKSFFNFKYEK